MAQNTNSSGKRAEERSQASYAEPHLANIKSDRNPYEASIRPSDLDGFIRLVNLVPREAHLPEDLVAGKPCPEEIELSKALDRLPDGLGRYLRQRFEQGAPVGSDEYARGLTNSAYVIGCYKEILQARTNLYAIANQGLDWMEILRFSGGSVISIGPGYKAEVRLDRFGEAIQGVDVRYLRECPECHHVFFAARIYRFRTVGAGCSPKCNRKRRNRKYATKPKKPPKFDAIQREIEILCKLEGWTDFQRTPENVQLLAGAGQFHIEECDAVLDYQEEQIEITRQEGYQKADMIREGISRVYERTKGPK